jgi:hypothetical protein
MSRVTVSSELPVSADEVWKVVGGFNALPDWHPGFDKSELDDGGKRRTLGMVGGGSIVETLVEHDDGGRTYTYEIKDSPLPITGYVGTIKVSHADERTSTIEWSSHFEPVDISENDATKMIRDFYQAGFENLRKMLEN